MIAPHRLTAFLLFIVPLSLSAAEPTRAPLLTVIDIDVDQTRRLQLSDGTPVVIRLLELSAEHDSVMQMVKRVRLVVEVNGARVVLESGNYQLPIHAGGVQIDCPVTRHYAETSVLDRWGLDADARLRIWPPDSPWIEPASFVYPVKQRWMAAMTWYSNEPVRRRSDGKVYYHAGMDIGATEAKVEVVAATDGVVVSAGRDVFVGDFPAVRQRYDVIYIQDSRGWLHRYSHLHEFDSAVKVGERVTAGQRLGLVGKQGASGGWSHLHYEIKSLQPSGKWGTQDSYAFLWQAYLREHNPKVLAIARPYQRVKTGETVQLTATLSWAEAEIKQYVWTFGDGTTAEGPEVTRKYDRPGTYSEILRVTDADGNSDYDFATVRVADAATGRGGPSVDANYYPSLNLQPGNILTFSSRGRGGGASDDTWDFGDGSPQVTVRSNLDTAERAADGYATTTHPYNEPGDYIVTVRKQNEHGHPATQHLHVHVGEPSDEGGPSTRDNNASLPRVPPREPADALKTFEVMHGFEMQLVASEPHVVDPVALAYDENGLAYVVEMIDYPHADKETDVPFQNQDAQPPLGQVRVLEDTDQDGRFDRSTVFADKLSWPSGIALWKGGAFVAATPDIWYLKDSDGDHQSDIRIKVFTGFNKFNVQAIVNNLEWGLDHHIYGAGSSNGGSVKSLRSEEAREISLLRRDFRIDPIDESFELLSGGARFGNTFDDWGNRFLCNIRNPCQHVVLPDRYLRRNRFLPVATTLHDAAPSSEELQVFPISPPERWRELRAGIRLADLNRRHRRDTFTRGYVTSSSGVTIYRGDAYPPEFLGNAFTAEVAWNLFYRQQLKPAEVTFNASRPDDPSEIVRSTDNWFRPVNFVNAPDGTLHVLDMYREVIEHPWSVPEELARELDFRSGADRGRIYRLAPPGFQHPKPPRLGQASTSELVSMLNSTNGWRRETAHRLLYERQDPSAVGSLKSMLSGGQSALGRLHALWSLHGLGALEEGDLLLVLDDKHSGVREHAVRLAESELAKSPRLVDKILELADDSSPRVRFQVALTLGELKGDRRIAALARIALRDRDDSWTRTAVLCSLSGHAEAMLARLLASRDFTSSSASISWLSELARLAAAEGNANTISRLLELTSAFDQRLRFAIAAGLGHGLRRRGIRFPELIGEADPAHDDFLSLMQEATAVATNLDAAIGERTEAIDLLSHHDERVAKSILLPLLVAVEPSDVQRAAVQSSATLSDKALADELVSRWRAISPGVRDDVLAALLSRPPWTSRLMTALEQAEIPLGQVPPAYRYRLLERASADVQRRAKVLFDAAAPSPRGEVIDNYKASLSQAGNAQSGQKVFARVCAKCHKLDGVGEDVGPALTTVRHRTPLDLMVNILDPNREVSPDFLEYVVVLDSGRVLTGVIDSESANSITLKHPESKQTTILRNDIEEIQSTGKSIMPEGLEKEIDPTQMADLIQYLLQPPAE